MIEICTHDEQSDDYTMDFQDALVIQVVSNTTTPLSDQQ